jgi:NAD-dependent dihydropyrimidine dehydrogenase PreA subunit
MGVASNPSMRVVLYEGQDSQRFGDDDRYDAMRSLLEGGYAATSTTSQGAVSQADSRNLVVLGRFPDGSPFAGQELETDLGAGDEGGLKILGNRDDGPDSVKVAVHDIGTGNDTSVAESVMTAVDSLRDQWQPQGASKWKPWFPVIDFDRCTNCMQCLSFCLFDVYGTSADGEIQVQNNDNCKTDCPACSRVCPEVAILFPKYQNGPINGDEIQQQDIQREKMKVDISSLLGGDIYSVLRERRAKSKSRFAKERDEDKALKERLRCLKKLSEGLEIPDNVLASLPSMDVIQQKAQEAQQKAQVAIDNNNQ